MARATLESMWALVLETKRLKTDTLPTEEPSDSVDDDDGLDYKTDPLKQRCAICLDRGRVIKVSITPCMHSFCRGCIERWDRHSKTKGQTVNQCPLCSSSFTIPMATVVPMESTPVKSQPSLQSKPSTRGKQKCSIPYCDKMIVNVRDHIKRYHQLAECIYCHTFVDKSAKQTHFESECYAYSVPCPFQMYGCEEQTMRSLAQARNTEHLFKDHSCTAVAYCTGCKPPRYYIREDEYVHVHTIDLTNDNDFPVPTWANPDNVQFQ